MWILNQNAKKRNVLQYALKCKCLGRKTLIFVIIRSDTTGTNWETERGDSDGRLNTNELNVGWNDLLIFYGAWAVFSLINFLELFHFLARPAGPPLGGPAWGAAWWGGVCEHGTTLKLWSWLLRRQTPLQFDTRHSPVFCFSCNKLNLNAQQPMRMTNVCNISALFWTRRWD